MHRPLRSLIVGIIVASVIGATAWLMLPLPDARLVSELKRRPDFLADHPELLSAARLILQQRQLESQGVVRAELLRNKWGDLLATDLLPAFGHREAPIQVVEFTDYSCAPCRSMAPLVTSTFGSQDDVRVVILILPTGGPPAEFAARAAFAAYRQDPGKFRRFHEALMQDNEPLTQERVLSTARAAGIDVTQLMQEVGQSDSRNYVRNVHELATDLGINGVPAIALGTQLLLGASTAQTLEAALARERKGSSI